MEDLIKIAQNGQWILEKSKKFDTERMIQEFLAQKKAKEAQGPAPAAPPKNPLQGLRPVQSDAGENPAYTKEQVAAIRAGLPTDLVDKMAPKPAAMSDKEKHIVTTQKRLEGGQKEADAKAQTSQGRKAAWEAGVAFLAQHGQKGYGALHAQMQERKRLDAAHAAAAEGKTPAPVKPQLLPPQEPFNDGKGNRGMRERQGTFHNEGATTTGKIVHKGSSYLDKETGEMKFASVPRQEKHHWSWDHEKKKWNHIGTTLGNPTLK